MICLGSGTLQAVLLLWAMGSHKHPAALPQRLDECLGNQSLERLSTGCSSNVGDQQQRQLPADGQDSV